MSFQECMKTHFDILMEGALGERLKREYGLEIDGPVALASLVYTDTGRGALSNLWNEYIAIARKYHLPFLATTPTRRANFERVAISDYSEQIIYDNVHFLKTIQENSGIEMYVGGLMGCKGDAYTGEGCLSETDAEDFHSWTVERFRKAEIDFLYAGIMPTLSEATGLAKAADKSGLPYIISFTIQENGTLIDGTPIADAIRHIDYKTDNPPVCYMANCVHPSIVKNALSQSFNRVDIVKKRFRGIQANTSPLSYAELDGAVDLKCSEPEEFTKDMMELRKIGNFQIWGGCCGTDNRHIESIAIRLSKRVTNFDCHTAEMSL